MPHSAARRSRWHAFRTSPWVTVTTALVVVGVAAYNLSKVPNASLLPAAAGLIPWVIGKYVLCPLRWHALSASGQGRPWHLRVYAESELLGILSPAHSGADLWRMHMLHKDADMDRPAAVADVALDRLVGAIALTIFAIVGGAALPPQILAAALAIAAIALVVALVVRRRRPGLLAKRPMPRPRVLAKGIALSLAYQATVVGLLVGTVAAVGYSVSVIELLGIFGASQVAGMIPGVHGASPREGALVAGLVTLGVPLGAALGAISLSAVLGWLPALALGGTGLAVRRLATRRAGAAAMAAPVAA